MPRRARQLVDHGVYHIVTRGNNKQVVFRKSSDFLMYLHQLAEVKQRFNIPIYHFVLMPNHVHLLLRATRAHDLQDMMKALNQHYSQYFSKKYRHVGHVWQGRFWSGLITREAYLLQCGKYIELNPVRAGLTSRPDQYRWTSYRVYALGETSRLVDVNPVYDRLPEDSEVRHQVYQCLVLTEKGTVPFPRIGRPKRMITT